MLHETIRFDYGRLFKQESWKTWFPHGSLTHISPPFQGYLFPSREPLRVQKAPLSRVYKKAFTLIWSAGGKYRCGFITGLTEVKSAQPRKAYTTLPQQLALLNPIPLSGLYLQSWQGERQEKFSFWLLYFSLCWWPGFQHASASTQLGAGRCNFQPQWRISSTCVKGSPALLSLFASAFITWQSKPRKMLGTSLEKSCTWMRVSALYSETASVYWLVTSSMQGSSPQKTIQHPLYFALTKKEIQSFTAHIHSYIFGKLKILLRGLLGNTMWIFSTFSSPFHIPSLAGELPPVYKKHIGKQTSWAGLQERNFKKRSAPKLRKHILVSHTIKFTTHLPFTSNIGLGKQKEASQILRETDPWLTRATSCFYTLCFTSAASNLG